MHLYVLSKEEEKCDQLLSYLLTINKNYTIYLLSLIKPLDCRKPIHSAHLFIDIDKIEAEPNSR